MSVPSPAPAPTDAPAPGASPSRPSTAGPSSPDPAPADRTHRFVVDGPIDVSVQNLRGDLELRAEHGTEARVELTPHGEAATELAARLRIRCENGLLVVDAPADEFANIGGGLGAAVRSLTGSGDGASFPARLGESLRAVSRGVQGMAGSLGIRVVVPTGSRVVLSTGVGDVAVHGRLARCEARSGTGDVTLERSADGSTRVSTGTGALRLGAVEGTLSATTGSGDIRLGELAGAATVTAGTGDITVERGLSGSLDARTGLGDLDLAVVPGTAVRLDLTTGLGTRDVRLDASDGAGDAERTLEVQARSGKGDLRVRRAPSAA